MMDYAYWESVARGERSMTKNDYRMAIKGLTKEQLREIGGLPMTRRQRAIFGKLHTVSACREFLYDVWKAREEDVELKLQELAETMEEEREERRVVQGRRLPDWCYDEYGEKSWAFMGVLGVVAAVVVLVPALFVGYAKWLGILGAIGILYWVIHLLGWLVLPLLGGVLGMNVSAHRWWRGWQFGRRHSR